MPALLLMAHTAPRVVATAASLIGLVFLTLTVRRRLSRRAFAFWLLGMAIVEVVFCLQMWYPRFR